MKLIEWRTSKEISQTEAAKLCGVKQVTYHRWETGKSIPRVDQLDGIQKATKGKVKAGDFKRELTPGRVKGESIGRAVSKTEKG